MKISTGLEPYVRHQVLPTIAREINFFREDSTESIPVPNSLTSSRDVWIVEYRDKGGHPLHTAIYSIEPKVQKKGFRFTTPDEHPFAQEQLERELSQYGAPDDVIVEVEPRPHILATDRRMTWWEVEI